MAARQVSAAECFPHHSVGAGLLTRPPVLGWVSFHSEGFAPWGEFLSRRWERNQRIAGGGLRWASPPIVAPPPVPRLRGIPLYPHVIFPARKIWFRVDPSRAAGPWCGAKFRPVPFYRRAWFRPAVAEGAGRGVSDGAVPKPGGMNEGMSRNRGRAATEGRPYGGFNSPVWFLERQAWFHGCGDYHITHD